MNTVERFTLWRPEDPDDPSPDTSPVIIDGHRSALVISGRTLLRQYETASGYLLVTDFDCPFEEAVCFSLISKDLQSVLGEHLVGCLYSSYYLAELVWLDEVHFFATFAGLVDYRFYFTIASSAFPGFTRDWVWRAGAFIPRAERGGGIFVKTRASETLNRQPLEAKISRQHDARQDVHYLDRGTLSLRPR
ncbi:hypothetical protein [Pseudomonas sp. ACM7]|uniref:hypothetical protein n=1 Tax=Pseudomonas sp. ACM7 TaxID=2052956 RepID=UPI001010F48F|nr:hypothetical protein [Pseudomonas sp. ACM7]QAY92711.1 hypothetical protein CUN63_23675 [Pseudomonas sp. ACM7]